MKKTLTWLGVTIGSLAVFAGAGYGLTLVNKDSLATQLIAKYTGLKDNSASNSGNTSLSESSGSDTLEVTDSTNLDSILSNGGYNGSAALNTGKKILVSARGYGDRSAQDEMTSDSLFLMGKAQDTINNAVIMHLIDSGDVKLNDKLSKYDLDVDGADQVTVKDVMNQASGISADDLNTTNQKISTLVLKLKDSATYDATSAGTYSDSKVNSILQAAIIEKATGNSYKSVIQDLLDQLNIVQTTFGMKAKSVNYYEMDEMGSAKKQSNAALDTDAIDRLGKDQLVSSTSDMAQLYHYLFSSDYIKKSTLKKVFSADSKHIAGFTVKGDQLTLTQKIGGGRNRIEWDLKHHQGTFLFSNYLDGTDNLPEISDNMLNYL